MTKQEFLQQFERSLLVGEPKRGEIVAELSHHINEDGIEHLGDPKTLASEYNRVHFGRFGTFRWLLARNIIAFFLSWQGVSWLIILIAHFSRQQHSMTLFWLTILSEILVYVNLLTTLQALAKMHQRWRRAAQWLLLSIGLIAANIIYYVWDGISGAVPLTQVLSSSWYFVWTFIAENIIFVLAFFLVWPTNERSSHRQKIILAVLSGVIFAGLWYFSQPLIETMLSNILFSSPIRFALPYARTASTLMAIGIGLLFLLHEFHLTKRLKRKSAIQ